MACHRASSTGHRPVSMIAGLSESTAGHRHISESPAALVFTPQTDRRTVVNLSTELDTTTTSHDDDTLAVTEVTSTGTNTTSDIVVTEDQATETG